MPRPKVSHFLFTQAGKRYLALEYVDKARSTYDIAKEYRTYPNAVRRALIAHKLPMRDKSEAQRAALDAGRAQNPNPNPEDRNEQ